MQNFLFLNRLTGWLAFAISAGVYIATLEPTASFWDCGGFIAASYKLLIGHPPGAPFYMLVGRFFSLFATDPSQVAFMVNLLSALVSALTIAFLFWTITHLARKIFLEGKGKDEPWREWAVLAAGFTGAMAYTFSDTFWFSAVEAEVYAMSSLFTAIVFWAILKWEDVAHEPHSNRWLLLIAYLMGLSIGVHLLNLLAIPAIVMIYYFKKFEVTRVNSFKAILVAGAILGFILYVIIPGVVRAASWFELFFVNELGLPFNSGVAFYALLGIGLLCYGIYYTYKNNKPVLNTVITGIAVIIFGYSSYALIAIRSSANPTMDQNSPDNVFSLLSFLNREQYGDRPLFFGQYYNSPIDWEAMEGDEGRPVFAPVGDRYEIIDRRPEFKFDPRTTTFFPRMHSREQRHIDEYQRWANIQGRPVSVVNETGATTTIQLPTFWENLKFFFNYQVRFMYFRYFMWNFAGRQNDIQGHGEIQHGNWISGIPFIDNLLYGDQSKLPEVLKNNPGRNTYFMLPLLLGLLGLMFQYHAGSKGKRDFWVIMSLFFFTGLAIVIYLNQTPLQPRERDYAYAGSFYAFAIWIGLGVLALVKWLRKVMPGLPAAAVAFGASVILVPGIMAKENWDDHDRSHRTIARDLAYNYLNTIGENGVIFTNGDNDTFPLWYIQEVEGIRTDVRVCNLSYLQTDWYIEQMKRKSYESDPLPFSLEKDQFRTGTRDVVHLIPRVEGRVDAREAMRFLASENPRTKQIPNYSGRVEHFPTRMFSFPVNRERVLENGFVSPRYAHLIDSVMQVDINKERILKNEMMVIDLLAHMDWERPIYFAVTVGHENFVGLDPYFQLEGFAYQVVPIRTEIPDDQIGQVGRVDTGKMYDKVMNKFLFNGWNNPRVYLDENHLRMATNIRHNLSRLATALIEEGEIEKAVNVLDKTMEVFPHPRVPHNFFSLFLAEAYYQAGEEEKGDAIIRDFARMNAQELYFFSSLRPALRFRAMNEIQRGIAIYSEIARTATLHGRTDLGQELEREHEDIFQQISLLQQ